MFERVDAAVVVVELDPDDVEKHGSVQHVIVGYIWIWTLWCRGQVVFLTSGGSTGIHEFAELAGEWGHVLSRGLEVEVKAVNYSRSKRAEGRRTGLLWTEDGPYVIRGGDGSGGRAETALSVRGATDGEKNAFTVCLLTSDDIRTEFHDC